MEAGPVLHRDQELLGFLIQNGVHIGKGCSSIPIEVGPYI